MLNATTPVLKRRAVVITAASLLAAALQTGRLTAEEPTRGADALTVMSWNIRYDNPGDGPNAWPHRRDWVAEIVAAQEIDICGMQEVLLRQLNDLRQRLPEMDVYGVGRDDGQSRGEFTPLFYRRERFELLDKSTFWLSKTPQRPGSRDWDAAITRIASWVKLKDRRSGQVMYVINTHFDHRGQQARAESAALLVRKVREQFHDYPVILTGDFNTLPDSLPYRTLAGHKPSSPALLFDARQRCQNKPLGPDSTWSGFRAIAPQRRIDFIFVTASWRVEQHRILDNQRDGKFPSDHLPVVATIAP